MTAVTLPCATKQKRMVTGVFQTNLLVLMSPGDAKDLDGDSHRCYPPCANQKKAQFCVIVWLKAC